MYNITGGPLKCSDFFKERRGNTSEKHPRRVMVNMQEQIMEERRSTQRYNLGEGELIVANINGNEKVIRVLDISPEGMKIRVPEMLELGTEIFVKIEICPETAPFYAQGSVVRVEQVQGKCDAGVKFFIVRVYNFFDETKK